MTALSPILQKKFNGTIWRMDIDEVTSALLLEIRNEADRTTSFAAINLPKAHLNFDGYTTHERWLTGMETAHNGVLLLHFFQGESSPVHKGIAAVNVADAAALWSNYSLAFDHLSINGPIMFNTQMLPKKLYVHDIETGKAIRPYNYVIDSELIRQIIVPQYISPQQLPAQLQHIKPANGLIHYIEHNSYRIVSLHTRNSRGLQQELYVLNADSICYEEILMTDIQKLQPEAFVLHKNWLICLKNKTELLVLEL
ncbi:DUF4905 domain-containing protein [Mucilaginibacter sp. UR6-1]|uniref:DUF4905 domain-containing protein n=1 Tax=Mucilaginibacter sp. UR6-1 TaxID=1435643 RepID=UPI001E39AC40|nr:DUF4905 domain-containing protein [Mucilaginibacter sp. UR6-1]MCC8409261.1 DUF4905 domain-containing protein [Mucilaginibacter sp. UR6-1]